MFLLFHGDNFWSCVSIHDMDFGKNFFENFFEKFFENFFENFFEKSFFKSISSFSIYIF